MEGKIGEMDLNKSKDFFDPKKVNKPCHVIGCGSIGSNVADLLVRYGITDITIWDMDKVEPHNIVNQLYDEYDVGKFKTEALAEKLYKINPLLKQTLKIKEEYTNEILTGYVFMCVDKVEVRQNIVEKNFMNQSIEAVFDHRTTLLEGQCYAALWGSYKMKESLRKSLDFTHDEAKANTPVSACGFELSVAPVVRMTSELNIANFTNFINTGKLKHLILVRPYDFSIDVF